MNLIAIQALLLSSLLLATVSAAEKDTDYFPSPYSINARVYALSHARPYKASRFWVGLQNDAPHPMKIILNPQTDAAFLDASSFAMERSDNNLLYIEETKISVEHSTPNTKELGDDSDGDIRIIELHNGEGIGRIIQIEDNYTPEIFKPSPNPNADGIIVTYQGFDAVYVTIWGQYPKQFDDKPQQIPLDMIQGQVTWAQPTELLIKRPTKHVKFSGPGITLPRSTAQSKIINAQASNNLEALAILDTDEHGKPILFLALRNLTDDLLWINQDDLQKATLHADGAAILENRPQTNRAYVPIFPGESLSLKLQLPSLPQSLTINIAGEYRGNRFPDSTHDYDFQLTIEPAP